MGMAANQRVQEDALAEVDVREVQRLIDLLPRLEQALKDIDKIIEGCPVARHILGR